MQDNDDHIFAGLWNHLVGGFWGGTNDGPAANIIVDSFSRVQAGEMLITGSLYRDVAVRWPQLFSYSFA